jgi:hypothetical protein
MIRPTRCRVADGTVTAASAFIGSRLPIDLFGMIGS